MRNCSPRLRRKRSPRPTCRPKSTPGRSFAGFTRQLRFRNSAMSKDGSFTGAFQVLLGSSIHSRYSFREDKIINEHFSAGELSLEEVQLLKLKDVRLIRAGRNFIHSLFHLDRPSATITIRTEHTPSAALQYDYRKPHFALDPFFRNPVLIKKLQTVGLLLGMKHKNADSMIADLVCSSDFHTAYFVLAEMFQQLLNVSSREKILQLVKQRYLDQDPVETILDWVEELGHTRVLGSKETNAMGMPEFDDSYVFVLECLLLGLSELEINQRATEQYPPENAVELIAMVPALTESLRNSTLFKSLLAD